MADIGIKRPVEFEQIFLDFKEWHLIDRFTELVVLSAYVGFYFEREGNGPGHNAVQWQYFTPEEKNRLFALVIAHSIKKGAVEPELISPQRRKDMFAIVERYVHGGLLQMREQGAFSQLSKIGYGSGLATFIHRTLEEPCAGEELKVQDLLRDLQQFDNT